MEFLVIGAGPAGCLAAILLARASQRVTLVEQSRFPRDKVCGECLSALGRDVLRRHHLEPEVQDQGAIELTHADLITASEKVRFPLPDPMLGISRSVLDTTLLEKARATGVTIMQPVRVVGAATTTTVDVQLLDLSNNTRTSIRADQIVLADGRGTLLGERPAPTGDLGIKTHFVNVDASPNTITLYTTPPTYGGVAPIEKGRWNVAFSVPADTVKRAAGDIDRVFWELVRTNPTMQRDFARAARVIDWIASPLPRYAVRTHWPANITPIGNAAAAIEPIGGEGMGLALRSAELAVQAILSGTTDQLKSQYDALWRKRSLFCRLGALAMSNRFAASLSVDVLSNGLVPANRAMSLVGK
jgi:flavin-dependent dehydrogenase